MSRDEQSCRQFTVDEIKEATNNFDDELIIGKGGFGSVYLGGINNGAKFVAIKRLSSESNQGDAEFSREIETLSKLQHDNLVHLEGYCNESNEKILVYEYMPSGTLVDHLYKTQGSVADSEDNGPYHLTWEERLNISIGAAQGIEFLHNGVVPRVIHRDIKDSNILIDSNLRAKIADFGLAKLVKLTSDPQITTVSTTIVKGTIGYLDPEYFYTQRLTTKTDVYAFGVVLLVILSGRPAVDNKAVEDQRGLAEWATKCIAIKRLDLIIDPYLVGKISSNSVQQFVKIALKCLCRQSELRPTMEEVVAGLQLALEKQPTTSATSSRQPGGSSSWTQMVEAKLRIIIKEKHMKGSSDSGQLVIERRKKLPDPVEKEKAASLWSGIFPRVCFPVYFNEPISSLQRCFEDLEYSYLLDRAYEHGKAGDSLLRILNVAAFAVSGYASIEGRDCDPFEPLLGETYEAYYPEKYIGFVSEKVSHQPTVIACHCQGKGWKFYADRNLKLKVGFGFVQLDPVGTLSVEFDDGETFQWSKVSLPTCLSLSVIRDHRGTMLIRGNRQHSCNLKFKELSLLNRHHPHQVNGFVEDATGKKVATLLGRWDESMYYIHGEGSSKLKDMSNHHLLWKRADPPADLTRYNLTSFAITLNELTPGLKEKLPPTDSRLRPDQRHLENGEFDKANAEKLRLETTQRMIQSRKLQKDGWKPKWFNKKDQDSAFRYNGGYWKARESGNWDGCPDIFGEVSEES